MCGRVFVKTGVDGLLRAFAFAREGEAKALDNALPRFNGAPGQDYPIIVREPDTGGGVFMRARWGLIPRWIKEPKGGPRPINCTSERIATAPMFRSAYRSRRALLPIDGFFEWRAIKGEKVKQPYAVAMADGRPFALAAIWETWRHPETGEDIRTFAVVTCPANELVGQIPQPHAGHRRAGGLRAVAQRGVRSKRSPPALLVGADDGVADLHACEQAGE